MIDELATYNLMAKYPNTTDLIREVEKMAKAEAIDDAIKVLNSKSVQIIFDLPVEEVLGEDVDLDDFAMLMQDAIQVYRKMVFGTLEQLKAGGENGKS